MLKKEIIERPKYLSAGGSTRKVKEKKEVSP